MKQKLDCEKSRTEKYWEKFFRENQTGMIGMFQRWLKKKLKGGKLKHGKR